MATQLPQRRYNQAKDWIIWQSAALGNEDKQITICFAAKRSGDCSGESHFNGLFYRWDNPLKKRYLFENVGENYTYFQAVAVVKLPEQRCL